MRVVFILGLLLSGCVVLAQVDNSDLKDPDSVFTHVRDLTNSGNIAEAKQLCSRLIKLYPEYHDIVIYLAQLHGRDAEYSEAHSLLSPLLSISPPIKEAHTTAARLYYWENDWGLLAEVTSNALVDFPADAELLYLNALASYHLSMYDDALTSLGALDAASPADPRSATLRSAIFREAELPMLFSRYNFDYFEQPYIRNWHQLTVGMQYPVGRFKISPSLSAGHAIDPEGDFLSTSAIQANMDAYVDITETNYALLGYGIGTGTYLPRHRAIIHLWQSLPSGWGVSAGLRYFYFNEHFIFYALGVEKYLGNYWIDLKNYLFNKTYGWSLATYLTVRRYLDHQDHFFNMTVGYGTSPDEPVYAVGDLQQYNALSFRFSYQKPLGARSLLGAGVGYMYEEFQVGQFRNRYSGFVSYAIKIP